MWKKCKEMIWKNSSEIIGIDIGASSIKVAEISWQNNTPVLKSFGIKKLADKIIEDGLIIDSQQLMNTLRELLIASHINSKSVVIAVGGGSIFARELIFPMMSKEELKEAIKWDLDKYIPYTPASYYYDFSIVGNGMTEKEIKVLLVASPIENVNQIISVIKSLGLILIAIDIEPLALYRTVIDAKQSIVIDIGALLSQVTLFQNDSPAIIRNIPIGGNHFTQIIMKKLGLAFHEAEEMKHQRILHSQTYTDSEYKEVQRQMDVLVSEITHDVQRTAEYYQQENANSMIDKILITGGGANLHHLVHMVSKQLRITTILHNPLEKLTIPITFDKTYLEQVAPQLSIAIGLALRGGDKW